MDAEVRGTIDKLSRVAQTIECPDLISLNVTLGADDVATLSNLVVWFRITSQLLRNAPRATHGPPPVNLN